MKRTRINEFPSEKFPKATRRQCSRNFSRKLLRLRTLRLSGPKCLTKLDYTTAGAVEFRPRRQPACNFHVYKLAAKQDRVRK